MPAKNWTKKGWGSLGTYQKKTSPYCFVRLKRVIPVVAGKRRYSRPKYYKVQQKGRNAGNNTAWITLGCFDTENEAVDVLVDVAEMIRFIWMIKEF